MFTVTRGKKNSSSLSTPKVVITAVGDYTASDKSVSPVASPGSPQPVGEQRALCSNATDRLSVHRWFRGK